MIKNQLKNQLKNQQGASLLMVLVILGVLLLSSLALLRTTESSQTIAGNIAFKEAAAPAGDIGINLALTALNGLADMEVSIPGQYLSSHQTEDANGIPNTIDWSQVPSTAVQNYNVQHVTERLCTGTIPVTNFSSQCSIGQTSAGGSNSIGSSQLSTQSVYYRVTVRVTGPKNTLSFVQAIIEK